MQGMGKFFGLAALLAALLLGVAAAADPSDKPRAGLMWNKSGLPAVFPLQVKTAPGADYVLLLTDDSSGEEVLAAFIVGGRFFRVLVPPGRFRVRFATGVRWQGENAMFGQQGQTRIIEMPEPLTFEVRGLRTKAGHLIDLTKTVAGEMAQIQPLPQRICQRVMRLTAPCATAPGSLRDAPSRCLALQVTAHGLPAQAGRAFRVRNILC